MRRGALLLVAAAACGEQAGPVAAPPQREERAAPASSVPTSGPPLRNEAPPPGVAAGPRELPIERIPGLVMEPDAHARQDCRPSTVARRRFAGIAMRACGALDYVTDDDWMHARSYEWVSKTLRPMVDCAAAAIAAQRPFIVEERVAGMDSGVADGLVGVLEHGKLAVYSLRYDSNPCGGGCPERGHTTVYHCDKALTDPPAAQCAELAECFHCGLDAVEECTYGQKTP